MKIILIPVFSLISCGQADAVCGDRECAALCAQPPSGPASHDVTAVTPQWSDFEAELLSPLLSEMKDGVRLFDTATGLGVCRGQRRCDTFVGRDVDELPAGEFMVRAELKVPRSGPRGTWEVAYKNTCDVIDVDGNVGDQTVFERTYSVQWGGPNRAFRIDPIERITSPNPAGAMRCAYTLTPLHPGAIEAWTGTYGVPGGA